PMGGKRVSGTFQNAPAVHFHQRFGAIVGEGSQTRPDPGGKDDSSACGRHRPARLHTGTCLASHPR
ncbi:MAG TPA: hypothetical protein PKA88_14765, partial [Polyangiaceae bacterium]|nr:hypothetical protein [Polyangiaceae bacterium]